MKPLAVMLLVEREAFWEQIRGRNFCWRDMGALAGFIVLACAAYGAVLAGWRSPLLMAYVALKLPLLFLGTAAIVAIFNWLTATALGSGLSFKSTIFIVLAALTMASWLLLSLVPVAIFLLATAVPESQSHDGLRYAHNVILITHILILALAGTGGNIALFAGIRRMVRSTCSTASLFLVWLAAFAFVGCQMSWILRPFVGSPFFPVAFMRPDCLERNFYEFVFTEVLPFIFTGGK